MTLFPEPASSMLFLILFGVTFSYGAIITNVNSNPYRNLYGEGKLTQVGERGIKGGYTLAGKVANCTKLNLFGNWQTKNILFKFILIICFKYIVVQSYTQLYNMSV